MRVLGIDPGIMGAAAIYDLIEGDMGWVGSIIDIADLPVIGEGASRGINAAVVFGWIRRHQPTHAVIENVWSMPKEGVSSAFRFGRAVGALQASVACAGVPLALVAPAVWKRSVGLLKQPKEASRLLATQRHPEAAAWLQRKKDHQRAEAILLSVYYAESIRNRAG